MKVISRKPLNLAEVKEIIDKKEEKPELSQELSEIRAKHKEKVNMLRKYIKKFSVLDIKKAEELSKELKNLNIMNLSDEYIVKIVDILPRDPSDVRKIVSGVDLKKEHITKILECVNKYIEKGERKQG